MTKTFEIEWTDLTPECQANLTEFYGGPDNIPQGCMFIIELEDELNPDFDYPVIDDPRR